MNFFAIVAVLAFCFTATNCGAAQDLKTVRAEGLGMAPMIRDGDKLVIDRRFYETKTVNRFDIVAISVSRDLFHYKRVIGLPNEKIEIKNGEVFINGELLNEPFEKEPWTETNFPSVVIPENEYFVLGDNRPNSSDSRIWQPATVKRKDILGKIIEVIPAKK